MAKKETETIIIGGGISGLSCARKLHKNKRRFILITEDIGGRILMSNEGNVPYEVYFIGGDYNHTSKFFKKTRRLSIFNIKFHSKSKIDFTTSSIKYPQQLLKTIYILTKFRRHYKKLKKQCETISQKRAIKSNKYLYKLYNQKAKDFVNEQGISNLVNNYLGKTSYGLLFCKLNEIYAFEFLRWMQYLIVPAYEFKFLKNKITKGFEKDIILDSALSLRKTKSGYNVKTKSGKTYSTKNIVIATPPHISKRLLKLKKIKNPAKAYMFHIRGKVTKNLSGKDFNLFHEGKETFDIAKQSNDTYLFYCDHPKPKLNKYFKKHKIIAKKHWNPAFNIKGNVLLDCKQNTNLYLIGDHNICGMEDSFITGIYAANKIISN